MSVVIKSKAGQVLLSGRKAADLTDCEVTMERGRVVIRATLRDVNGYRLASSETFDVLLELGGDTRIYRDMPITVYGTQVTFIKGEEKHGQE